MLNALQGAAQSVHHTASGVRFNGKTVHSTPCTTHKSVVSMQRAHYSKQTQANNCTVLLDCSASIGSTYRTKSVENELTNGSDEFIELDADIVEQLVSSNHLIVPEERVFSAAQSVHHTASGVRFNGKTVHSTPCTTHKSVVSMQRAHYSKQTQANNCTVLLDCSASIGSTYRTKSVENELTNGSDEFIELDADIVEQLVSSNHLIVPEERVFSAVSLWVEHDVGG
ncbi:hypothetical protein CSKR_114477 [Clonorchis sinensis]|uniref:Uncharacterized protein n=1 Tax=Clonorchis sinensis TaxID=79923 RepID=A0A3R7DGE8_CLOSI|nr:hypothetical protein CSKR_114477 [Clonorchis sinensis]